MSQTVKKLIRTQLFLDPEIINLIKLRSGDSDKLSLGQYVRNAIKFYYTAEVSEAQKRRQKRLSLAGKINSKNISNELDAQNHNDIYRI